MRYHLNQYGAIEPDEEGDVNAGLVLSGVPSGADHATQAVVTTEHPELHPRPGLQPIPADPDMVLPITVKAWSIIVQAVGELQQKVIVLETTLKHHGYTPIYPPGMQSR